MKTGTQPACSRVGQQTASKLQSSEGVSRACQQQGLACEHGICQLAAAGRVSWGNQAELRVCHAAQQLTVRHVSAQQTLSRSFLVCSSGSDTPVAQLGTDL